MKVAHLTSVHGPRDSRIFDKECTSLARAGYDVSLVAPGSRSEVVDGVQIRAVDKSDGRLARMTLCVRRVYKEALRQAADVYHLHDPELIPAGLLLRLRGKKVIHDVHEDLPRTIGNKSYLPAWLHGAIRWACEGFESATLRHFTALVAATPQIGARMSAINPRTVVVNNFPIVSTTQQGAPLWATRESSISYIGSITEPRGIRELVAAMALLPGELQTTRLALAGSFSPATLQAEVNRLDGWNRVDYLGVLDRRGVSDLLARVRVGMVVLHSRPNYVCSRPIKLFEYMLAGLPVIASDFPVWREIVEDSNCGLLVDPMNPQAIADAITHLLTHPREAEEMGRRGRAAVLDKFNWRCEEEQLLALYRSIAAPGSLPQQESPQAPELAGVQCTTPMLNSNRQPNRNS